MDEINPKFIKIQQTPTGDSKIKRPASNPLKNSDFNRVLNDQLKKDIQSTDLTGTPERPTLPELQSSFRAQALNLRFDTTRFTQKLEASLSRLESYAVWLDDPEKSLKQTHGLLEQLLESTQSMEKEFEPHKNAHPDLAQLLSQLKTTLEVEQIKLDRGDYISG